MKEDILCRVYALRAALPRGQQSRFYFIISLPEDGNRVNFPNVVISINLNNGQSPE
jgi:hypothetical protein